MAMLREAWQAWLRLTRYQQGIVIIASLLVPFDLYVKNLTTGSIVMITAVAVALLPPELLSILKRFELFGLLRVEIRKGQLQEAANRIDDAGFPEPAMEQRDQPIYEQIYDDDPRLALAALRIDIFKQLRNLAKLAEIDVPSGRRLRWRRLVEELQFRKILTTEQAAALSDLIPLLDKASRSDEYSTEAADLAIKTGPKLIAGLQALAMTAGGTQELLSGNRPG